jgi:mannose-1-phosphate guanylyltransferase
MKAVIFAGGIGTRLWPLSRKNTPKQFEKIIENKSMLQLAVDRLFPLCNWEDIFISTGKKYKDIVRDQLPQLPEDNIIVEPEMRDVGPAVGLVIANLVKKDPNEPVALLWGSDHMVKKEEEFRHALKVAEDQIKKDPEKIIFLSQKPRFASQNLGYIEFGGKLESSNSIPVYEFLAFKYRPDLELAEKYLADGHHSWNLGYFVTTPGFVWTLFKDLAPDLYEKLVKIQETVGTDKYQQVLGEIYPTIEKINFDNSILEKMDKNQAEVLAVDIGWSDVGAWEALKEAITNSVEENALKGQVVVEDCRDSLVFNYSDKLVVGIDLDQMLVVDTDDVLLVCPQSSVPKLKKLLEKLANSEYEKLT